MKEGIQASVSTLQATGSRLSLEQIGDPWRRTTPWIWVFRFVLAGVFLWACVHKIHDPAAFAKSIYNYQLLPSALINVTALVLPWLELWAGVAVLCIPPLRRGALVWLGGLLLAFTVAIALALFRGIDVECGCLSTEGGRIGTWSLMRNVALMGLVVVLWRDEHRD